ncbi:FkbM family methyltransferase [Sphingomonas sp.]|jgi:FkbM family methyltransferase|uniref:FkbM family methyltransferase n=1 Tax=Sphingomonas sp. TaxID=28214 RepID=UPI002E3139AB|nr:FkbM family methyltransferase [Sphingomonas sp.]HEX4695913.1 FkbM family methyltransferase [Sphingomonas sp.]
MTSLATHAKRFIGPLLANRWTGIVAARVLRDRIPHRGLTIDTSSPVVTPEIKAALLMRGYESSEYRFVRQYIPTDCDVIELGGSLGVISCTIRRRIDPARRQFIVEADPRLAKALRRNLAINHCDNNVEVIETAISYDPGETVSFALGESSVSGRIAADGGSLPTIEVPACTLGQLIKRHGLTNFALVSDIEGVEWRILQHDLDALARARMIVMETHKFSPYGTYDDLIAALLATGRFSLRDRHGPVIVLEPTA